MTHDRRSFIKRFGVTLGSLIVSGSLAGCGPKKEVELSGAKGEVATQDEPSPGTRTLSAPEWEQVRQCWLDLKTVDEETDKALREMRDRNRNETMMGEKVLATEKSVSGKRGAAHKALLDALVARGLLEKRVAEHMQVAFEEAIYHIIRSRGTCYYMIPIQYAPRKDLLEQADLLRNVSADLNPATVAKAQAAIAQDVVFFEAFRAGGGTYDASLDDNYKSGRLNASPDALEAARLLTRLFVETPG